MNKTIEIAKASYTIDPAARTQLEAYLAALRRTLKADKANETISDVELHITEILQERGIEAGDNITKEDVQAIQEQLGDPTQFGESANTNAPQPRQKKVVYWLIAGALVLLLGSPAILFWDRIVPQSVKTTTETQDYKRAISSLYVTNESGNLEIRPTDNNEISIERHLKWADKKPTYSEKWNDDQLRITADCPPKENNCSIDYVIWTPRTIAVTAQTQAGNIDLEGVEGALRLTSAAGNIEVTQTKSALWARTNAGNIAGTRLAGSEADVQTDAGHIDLQFAGSPTDVKAKASDGNIDIRVPQGHAYQVRAETSSGRRSVAVPLNSTAIRHIDAQTSAGDVTIQNF